MRVRDLWTSPAIPRGWQPGSYQLARWVSTDKRTYGMVNPLFATAGALLSFRGRSWVSVQQPPFQSLAETSDGARQPANLRGVQDPRR
jgi:hypothetical protein